MKNYFIFLVSIIFAQKSFALKTNEDLVKYWVNINYNSCPEGVSESAAKRATFMLAPLLFNQCSGHNLNSVDKNNDCYRAITKVMQSTTNNPLRECERKNYNVDPLKPSLAQAGNSSSEKPTYDANTACKAVSKPFYAFTPEKISETMYTCKSTFNCTGQFKFGSKVITNSTSNDYDFFCGQYPKKPTSELCNEQKLNNCNPALGYQKMGTFVDDPPVFLVEFDRLGGLKVKKSDGSVFNPGSGKSGN
ncbi:MAG: hypothetical protein ACK4VO_01165 [Pseudobdellovibrio sp.]